ncbi:MAG: mandelate racemase/muconate lactonizing enzyme family protein [Ensifer adhaerens]
MPKIVDVRSGYFRLPLEAGISDSMHGVMTSFELNVVRIRDSEGVEGVGYTYTCGRNGGAIADLLARDFPELLIDENADQIEKLWEKCWWALHYGGRGGPTVLALSAVDIALWDLKGKRLEKPLWNLCGGYHDRVTCYAGGIDLDLPLEALLKQTDRNLGKGFRAIKMKVGRAKLSEDIERVAAMRDHLGPDFPLMVDANMKWSADHAIRAARSFLPFNLTWLEEPAIPDDVAGYTRIVAESATPIAAGENLRSLWEFKQLIASSGVTFPEPDVTNCGGITPFMKIAHLAEAYNLPVTSHGAHDVTVHLLSSVPNGQYLEAHGFGLDRYIEEPLLIEEGWAIAPSRPGHGIVFDWDGLETLRQT